MKSISLDNIKEKKIIKFNSYQNILIDIDKKIFQ